MSNPYAAPSADEEARGWQVDQRYVVTALGLGLAWWAVLLVPEQSREILLAGGVLNVSWGIVRVVAIVTGACLLYGRLHRAWPAWSWLTALLCLWAGCAVFVLTIEPTEPFGLALALVGPPFFVIMASYVVLPMTIVTAVVLARFAPRPGRAG